MADILWPPGLVPKRVVWTLQRNIATPRSPLSGTTQRWTRSGSKWRASIDMPILNSIESGLLTSFLDLVSRGDNVGLVPVFQNDSAGVESGLSQFRSLNAPWAEQPSFANWTHQGLVSPPYLSGGNLVLRANTGTPTPEFRRTFSAVAGLPYFFAVYVPPQQYPAGFVVGNAAFTQLYFDNRAAPSIGLITGVVTSNTPSITIAFTSPQPFQPAIFGAFTLSRCYVAQSAQAAGATSVTLNGSDPANQSPANLVRAIRPGQFAMVRANGRLELKRVCSAVDTVTGVSIGAVGTAGFGDMRIEPALRGAVSASAEIVTEQPFCRMRLAEPESTSTIDAPLFGGFAFDMVEEFGA